VRDYGQFCPIARSSELLAERWTPIIVRNLLNGCRTFNEIRQGAPSISTALLAQRLEGLERHGVLVRTVNPSGRGATYELTEMGQALRAVLDAMGQWGAHWLEIEPRHMDPGGPVRAARPSHSRLLADLAPPAAGAVHAPQWLRRGHRVPDRLDNAD